MGILTGPDSVRVTLGRRCLIGRSDSVDLRILDARVSSEHALLKWSGSQWFLRELGSLNGTYLDGQRIAPGAQTPLRCGARLGFAENGCQWTLADDAKPGARARRLSDGFCVVAENGLLSVPRENGGGISIYIGGSNQWELDAGHESLRPVADQEVVVVDDVSWLLELPATGSAVASTTQARTGVSDIYLRFRVDHTQEHVEIEAVLDGRPRRLPDRVHNQMLLALAREQVEDERSRGLCEEERGWIHIDDLAKKLATDIATLTVQIWRARKTFAVAGVGNPAGVVERRKYSGLVRLGVRVQEVTHL